MSRSHGGGGGGGVTGSLFVGRLPRSAQKSEIELLFSRFGKLSRCELKFEVCVPLTS